jgi:hypothetical protein
VSQAHIQAGEFPLRGHPGVPDGLVAYAQPTRDDGTFDNDRAGRPRVSRVQLRTDAVVAQPERPDGLLTDADWRWATSATRRWTTIGARFGEHAEDIALALARAGDCRRAPSAPRATPASASPTLASSATRPAPTRHARRNRGASSPSRLKPDGRKECRDLLNRMAAWDVSVVDRYLRWLLPDALTAIQPARDVGRSRTARGEAWHANASQDPGRRRDRLRGPAAITITVNTRYS